INLSLANYGCAFAEGAPLPQSIYPPNPAGYRGMCGNTWDWCRDSWNGYRTIRGGCWMDSERFCLVSTRYRNSPIDRDCTIGFRLRIACKRKRGNFYSAERSELATIERLLL